MSRAANLSSFSQPHLCKNIYSYHILYCNKMLSRQTTLLKLEEPIVPVAPNSLRKSARFQVYKDVVHGTYIIISTLIFRFFCIYPAKIKETNKNTTIFSCNLLFFPHQKVRVNLEFTSSQKKTTVENSYYTNSLL